MKDNSTKESIKNTEKKKNTETSHGVKPHNLIVLRPSDLSGLMAAPLRIAATRFERQAMYTLIVSIACLAKYKTTINKTLNAYNFINRFEKKQ